MKVSYLGYNFLTGYDFEETYVEEVEEPSRPKVENLKLLDRKAHDVLPGFSAASKSDYQLERYSHDTYSFIGRNSSCLYLLHL